MKIRFIRCAVDSPNLSARRRRRAMRGFAMLEMTITLFLAAILTGLLVQFLISANHVAINQQAGMTLQLGSQYNLDLLTQDVQSADLILSTYTNGSTVYTADTTSTLILRTPSLNAAQTATTTTSDHIIYQLVATANGAANGPYTLNRTVVPASGSGRAAVTNMIVANNVTSAAITYVGIQSQTQAAAGTAKQFTLSNGAAYAAPGSSTVVQQAIVQGTDLCAGSSPCYSGSTVNLGTAPAANATIDFQFTVSPSVTASNTTLTAVNITAATTETATFAKQVMVTLKMTGASGTGGSQSGAAPTITTTTLAAARNKAVF